MQRWSVVPGIVVLLIVSGILPVFGDDQTQPSTDANRVWRFHDGQWTEETTLPATAPADEPMLDRAEVLLQQGDPHDARKTLLAWEKVNKDNPSRDRCIFLLAQAFYQSDDRIKSFYYCDELMDEYPQSSLFQAALQKQYDIADAYLGGYKELFLFFRIGDRSPEAVQMMFRIQQRAPGSKLAEQALIRTADYYYASQQYDLAEDAYNPRSPPGGVRVAGAVSRRSV
jgi:tetratricopeptide (TPR) repeat protein